MKIQNPPPWLQEEPALLNLLYQFLDRLDRTPVEERTRKLSLRITRKTCPELFDFRGDTDYLWSLVRFLDKQCHVWSVQPQRTKPYEAAYENARLEFNDDAESSVREWLQRPVIDPYALIWQDAIEKNKPLWNSGYRFLLHSPLWYEGHSAEEVINALKTLCPSGKHAATSALPLTLRELSARAFWGDSKFVEAKESWFREAFPAVMKQLLPRPILLNVVVPPEMQGALWIENQDSFLRFAQHPPEPARHLALIYCAGFRATSPRIREPGHAVFCPVATPHGQQEISMLESLWRGEAQLPCAFWGDLDFAGMGILASLRTAFPSMEAWQPGYQRMAKRLEAGLGHLPEAAGKDQQLDPNVTGCNYADHVLLPLLRRTGRAIDQEAVDWESKN